MFALAVAGMLVAQAAPELRIARSLPCGVRYQPMAVRAEDLRARGLRPVTPPPRRQPLRIAPCFRLAAG